MGKLSEYFVHRGSIELLEGRRRGHCVQRGIVPGMHIKEIYERYQVPPWLQEHQVRVAAVGKMAAEAQRKGVDVHVVVSTCLLHDIGAIVKFDFAESFLADLVNPNDLKYWESVQARMREQYGVTEHKATEAILRELGAERERGVFQGTGLTRLSEIIARGSVELQIVQYADTRVGPRGIMSISARMDDARVRYAGKGLEWFERLDQYRAQSLELEIVVLAGTGLESEAITDAAIAPTIEQLWDYEIA